MSMFIQEYQVTLEICADETTVALGIPSRDVTVIQWLEYFVPRFLSALPKSEPTDAVKELGKRLAAKLDEDDWAHIEPFLTDVENSVHAAQTK